MKKILIPILLLLGSFADAQVLSLCGDLVAGPYPEFCSRMKHLRASINVLDQQRDMGLVNYQYISVLGQSIKENATQIQKVMPEELSSHEQVLKNLSTMGEELSVLADARISDVFRVSNGMRTQCLACHSTAQPRASGDSWNDVYKIDWEKITKNCNKPGRNPYLCKSMNGMATSYSHLLTAYTAKIRNYPVTAGVAEEVVRILKSLKENNFLHMEEDLRATAQASAEEVVALANAQNPEVFDKTLHLTNSCNSCHTSDSKRGNASGFHYNLWK